jgi:hypothetical protein
MKPVRKSGLRRPSNGGRDRREDGNERLVLLAIAILFVANVVVYLCHHYGLTSLYDWRAAGQPPAARVIVD